MIYFSPKEIEAMKAQGIGPCLDEEYGFTCTLRSDHIPSDHKTYNPHDNSLASWPYNPNKKVKGKDGIHD